MSKSDEPLGKTIVRALLQFHIDQAKASRKSVAQIAKLIAKEYGGDRRLQAMLGKVRLMLEK